MAPKFDLPLLDHASAEPCSTVRLDPAGFPTSDVSPTRTALARHVAQQLVAATPLPASQPVELRLNPEELGRVRLSFAQTDGSIAVTIIAERGETLDLLRRNIALLENEFRDIGFSDINFAFGSPDRNNSDRDSAPDRDDATAPLSEIVYPAGPADKVTQTRLAQADGLDLRI